MIAITRPHHANYKNILAKKWLLRKHLKATDILKLSFHNQNDFCINVSEKLKDLYRIWKVKTLKKNPQ